MSRKKIFTGRLINVFAGGKKLPGGRSAYLEEVEHPGAALLLCYISGKIVFIRQYRAVIGKYIWELPAGIVKRGETPYACAKREITEETGYVVKKLQRLGVIYTSPGFCNERIYLFKADCVHKEATNRGSDELIKVRLFDKKEVVRLFKGGKIDDSKTIAALAFDGVL